VQHTGQGIGDGGKHCIIEREAAEGLQRVKGQRVAPAIVGAPVVSMHLQEQAGRLGKCSMLSQRLKGRRMHSCSRSKQPSTLHASCASTHIDGDVDSEVHRMLQAVP
jgi:hypothetical protein